MHTTTQDTPVLLLIFNRPKKVRQMITALAEIKPKKIYVVADGPRLDTPSDRAKCEEARAIVDTISWDCQVVTHFHSQNLGCRDCVSTGISWFFEQVPEGIILEDDCIPHISFFRYCTQLLARYRDEPQVMHIGGTNFLTQNELPNTKNSYFFSHTPLVWGWATWREAWEKFDTKMQHVETVPQIFQDEQPFKKKFHGLFWISLFRHVKRKDLNTWATRWAYTVQVNNGLCTVPKTNLVKNIGFDNEATNTKDPAEYVQETKPLPEILTHPTHIEASREVDEMTMNKIFVTSFVQRLKIYVKNALKL